MQIKQGRKISDFCLKQGQDMRGRAAPPHPRIYRVPPPPPPPPPRAHNTLIDLHNSSYHNEPSLMIVYYIHSTIFNFDKKCLPLLSSKRLPVFLGSSRLWRDFSPRKFSSNSSCHPLSGIFAIFARFQGSISAIFLCITRETFRHFFQLGQKAEQPSLLP